MGWILLFLCGGTGTVLHAQTYFSQDFSSSTALSSYIGSGENQFDGITSSAGFVSAITSETLQARRNPDDPNNIRPGAFTRITDLPTTAGAIYRFSIKVTSATNTATSLDPAIMFQVGNGFTTSASFVDNSLTHSQFAINLNTDGSLLFRDPVGSTNGSTRFSGQQNVFFVVNNSGGTLTYTAPDNSLQTVGNDKWDLWVGTSQQFNEVNATTATIDPTDFKLAWRNGNGTIQFDDFSVSGMVPEPATSLGAGLLATAGIWRVRRRLSQLLDTLE